MDCSNNSGIDSFNCSLDHGKSELWSNGTSSSELDGSRGTDLFFWLSAPFVTFLYACIFVIGVIGNLLVCYVVVAYKDMRDNIFHIFLA